jgi:hypothetical protein
MASSIVDSLQSFQQENGRTPRQQSKEEKKKCQDRKGNKRQEKIKTELGDAIHRGDGLT